MAMASGRASLGVSLVELLTAMVVIGIVAVMASGMIANSMLGYRVGQASADVAAQAQLALERMTREMRDIRSARPSDGNAEGDLTPAAAQLDFINLASERFRFRLNNNSILMSTAASEIALADSVSGLSFEYLQSDGRTVAATAPLVYYVSVTLTVSSEEIARSFTAAVKPTMFSP